MTTEEETAKDEATQPSPQPQPVQDDSVAHPSEAESAPGTAADEPAQTVAATAVSDTSESVAPSDQPVAPPACVPPAQTETPAANAPEPVASPTVEQSSAAPVDAVTPTESGAGSETPSTESSPVAAAADTVESQSVESEAATTALDRMRKSQASTDVDKPVGSVDLQAQRPDVPTDAQPVDIPDANEELAPDLEAEISAAMAGDSGGPVTTVPVPAEEVAAAMESADASTAAAPVETEEVGPGSSVTGPVQQIHGDDVFINAGLVSDVVVPLKQFPENKPPAVGDSVTAIVDSVDDDGLFRARLPQARTKARGNWDALSEGQVVDCQVTGTNKGGLQVIVSHLKGFLPASQVDLGYVSDLEQYVGQKLTVKITEVKPKKRNLVVSRRVLLQEERESAQAGFWETLEVGQDHTGTVKTLKNYGAFVNLGPIDGFLHVGEISWSRINHPNEVLKEGMEVQVRILKIDREKNRISLSMKQLVQNPWMGLAERYPSERIVSGKVTRVADFGAFVELEPGVEGLVHISELAWRRVGSVNEVLQVGNECEFKVLEVDQRRRRVSLSLKALEQKPEPVARAEAEQEARPQRRENPDLRGGMGGSKDGGGLFGNPSDFT